MMSLSDAKCNAANKGLQGICTNQRGRGIGERVQRATYDRDQFCNRVSSRFFRVHGWSGRVRCPLENRRRRRNSSSRTATRTNGRTARQKANPSTRWLFKWFHKDTLLFLFIFLTICFSSGNSQSLKNYLFFLLLYPTFPSS